MARREFTWITLRVLTGVCAAFVTIRGAMGVYGMEFRQDTVMSVLYCALPFLSFFVFLFARRARLEFALHTLIAVGYLCSFVFLNWRTCMSFGYCTTLFATVWTTLMARPVLAAFAVVLLSAAGFAVDSRTTRKRSALRSEAL